MSRVRENANEFGRSGKTGKILLDSARSVSTLGIDKNAYSRLAQAMKSVINADRLSDRGMRSITSDGLPLLRGFDFNKDAKLTSIFFAPFDAVIDRTAGTGTISVPQFIPERMMKWPPGATHATIVSGVAEIDFVTGAKTVTTSESAEVVLGGETAPAITLNNTFTANSARPVFLVMGLRFFLSTNGKRYEQKDKTFTTLSIVEISTPA